MLDSAGSGIGEGEGGLFRAGFCRVCGGVEVLAYDFVFEQFFANVLVECEQSVGDDCGLRQILELVEGIRSHMRRKGRVSCCLFRGSDRAVVV